VPRKNRSNRVRNGQRSQDVDVIKVGSTASMCDKWARDLVDRGLATGAILDPRKDSS
jgi:hypothetical protein